MAHTLTETQRHRYCNKESQRFTVGQVASFAKLSLALSVTLCCILLQQFTSCWHFAITMPQYKQLSFGMLRCTCKLLVASVKWQVASRKRALV